VDSLLRRFLPPHLRSEDSGEARRAQVVVAGCLSTALVAGAVAGMQLALGIPISAAAAAVCALFAIGAAFALRWTGAVRAVAMTVCSAVWFAAFAVAVATDGALAASLFYLALTPAMTSLVLGVRWGIACGASTLVVLAGLLVFQQGMPSVAVDPEVVRGSAIRGAIVFDVALVGIAAAWEWLRGRSERSAAESEQRYRALAAHGSDLITELDGRLRILFASPNHGRYGTTTGGVLGIPAFDRVHPDDRHLLVAAGQAMARSGTARSQPVRIQTDTGEWPAFEISLTSYETPNGERRIITVSRDVTERLALEARLRQAQKMEAVGQLAGGAAHDFNNLLLVITGYAQQLAEQHDEDTDERIALDEILAAADRAAGVTRRLLTLARPAGEARERIDPNRVVAELEPLLLRLVRSDVALDLVLGDGLPAVTAEAGQVEQVLVNLALNAADAMPDGGSLRIETSVEGEHARIIVTDTGSGMDEATLARAREPFFTTKPAGVGSGLGLYMVETVVRSLGGSVAIESRPAAGTTVSIRLPGAGAALPTATSEAIGAAPRGSEAILVVDDGPQVRDVMCRALTRAGYRVLVASDGLEAMERAAADPSIALVVSDVVMPKMGGFELLAALRAKRPELPVLLVSGHPGEVIGDETLPDAVDLLAKPFSLDELRRRVRALLDAA
jgi:hypothetical protein